MYDGIDKLVECCTKYADYLEEKLVTVYEYQSNEEPLESTKIFTWPVSWSYPSKREKATVELLGDKLSCIDLYEPINIDEYLKGHRAHHYVFMKHLKDKGHPIDNVILYVRYYGPDGRKMPMTRNICPLAKMSLNTWRVNFQKIFLGHTKQK